MKTSKFLLIGSAIVLIALSIMPVVTAQAAFGGFNSQAASSVTTTKVVPAAQQSAALSAWTHAAFAAARPLDTMIDYGSAKAQAPALGALQLPVAGGSVPAGAAVPGAAAAAQKGYPADWSAGSAQAASAGDAAPADLPAGTSQDYTSYIVNGWAPAQNIYPHKWVGRLFFNTGSGGAFCSATAQSGNNIVTAAHCVYDTTYNRWYYGWVFTPAYRAGSAPFGSFAATACTVLNTWVNLSGSYTITGWTKYDVAVCTLGKNSLGQTINTAVGWAGQQWDWGYVRDVFNMGYPFNDYNNAALTFAGAYLRTCTAETFFYTTDTLGEGCNWGPGISGGPWMIGYAQSVVVGYVDSVHSGLYIGQQNLYGIRFASTNIRVICAVRGC